MPWTWLHRTLAGHAKRSLQVDGGLMRIFRPRDASSQKGGGKCDVMLEGQIPESAFKFVKEARGVDLRSEAACLQDNEFTTPLDSYASVPDLKFRLRFIKTCNWRGDQCRDR
jgi:hypothetical protein